MDRIFCLSYLLVISLDNFFRDQSVKEIYRDLKKKYFQKMAEEAIEHENHRYQIVLLFTVTYFINVYLSNILLTQDR